MTGVYKETSSRRAEGTTAYVHNVKDRCINSKKLWKQTTLRGWICDDEIYRLSRHDLPGYL